MFSYNADSHTNKRLAYIGQDLFLSGQMMGERIVKLVGSGKVAIFIATPGQLNLQPRVDGAMDSIKKSGADIQATMIATAPAANAGRCRRSRPITSATRTSRACSAPAAATR